MDRKKDLFETREVQEWLERVQREMFPKLKASAMSVTILTADPDAKLCVELGAAILFDKPLIILVPRGEPISANLKRVATTIIEGDPTDPGVRIALQQAITAVIDNDARVRRAE